MIAATRGRFAAQTVREPLFGGCGAVAGPEESTFTINVGNASNGDPTWRKAACGKHVALWL